MPPRPFMGQAGGSTAIDAGSAQTVGAVSEILYTFTPPNGTCQIVSIIATAKRSGNTWAVWNIIAQWSHTAGTITINMDSGTGTPGGDAGLATAELTFTVNQYTVDLMATGIAAQTIEFACAIMTATTTTV